MITTSQIVTRSATKNDLSKLANLIHFEAFVHRHLDYRPPLDWVGRDPFLVLEDDGRIEAAIACPPDPPSVGWIRLFAASSIISPEYAWNNLWDNSLQSLVSDHQVKHIAAIPLYHWFRTLLKKSGFEQTFSIVMLSRDTSSIPNPPPSKEIAVRPMTLDDLNMVQKIDEDSFTPVWANSVEYLEIAFRQAIAATVAEADGELAGYQISTATTIGAHLARLAVLPKLQGKGIGYALLYDLIHQISRRGSCTITVNTQKNNSASLHLYKKVGFEFSGEDYPIYQLLSFPGNIAGKPNGNENSLKLPYAYNENQNP